MTHFPTIATIATAGACLLAISAATPVIAGDLTSYPTVRDTRTPDYGRPAWTSRGGTLYPTVPGTQTPDYGSPERRMVRDGKVYQVIPGTSTPDYGSGQYILKR